MSRRERQRRKRRNQSGPSGPIFLTLGMIGATLGIALFGVVAWVVQVANSAPPLDTRKPINLGATSRVFAADGTRLGFIQASTLRTPVSAKAIPNSVGKATVAIEDRRFYEHKGVDFEGIVRAAVRNIESKKDIQGGSTLTMQLVRNLYTGERARSGIAGYKRKIREAKLAEELENLHPGRQGKQWILDKYVNSVPYGTVGGQTAVGIQAAARVFFNRPAAQLTLRQAALLAGLPQAPSEYNPFLNPNAAIARRNDVLQHMADQGYISQAKAAKVMRKPLGVHHSRFYTARREDYFFDFVKQQLIDKYGLDTVRRGGLKVYTTIDLRLQKLARASMDGQLGAPDRSGAIVTIDPRTGYIKAMASSSRYGDSKFNLAAQGHRQAGSTFKVMVLMTALARGVDPNRTTYVSHQLGPGWLPSAPDYGVQTYSHSYGGSMNLVRATLISDNTVYAQLDADLGPDAVARTAREMGITSPLHGYPAEGLGGLTDGVSPLEMARAYASVANGGYRIKPAAIRKVVFPDGRVDDLGKPIKRRIFSDGVAYEAIKILKQNIQSGTGFPNATVIGCPAGGKTGTVDSFSDAWFVGFTPHLSTAMWLGHSNSRIPMPGVAGGTIPATIWGRYMREARGRYCGDFPLPKTPFHSQPFFGRYARGGGRFPTATGTSPTVPQGPTVTPPPAVAAPPTTPSTGGTDSSGAGGGGNSGSGGGGNSGAGGGGNSGSGGGGGGGGNGGGTQFPPDAYQSPPQPPPTTQPPPGH